MDQVTEEILCHTMGKFTWFWGSEFFIETDIGNFVWSDPDYEGTHVISPFNGTYDEFCKKINIHHGRDKGRHLIGDYCGIDFTLSTTPFT